MMLNNVLKADADDVLEHRKHVILIQKTGSNVCVDDSVSTLQ